MERSPIAARIESLVGHYQISLKELADRLDVQRSSLSHILSGRNKPSLDFILKLLQCFPDLNEKWLLHGKGEIQKEETVTTTPARSQEEPVTSVNNPDVTGVMGQDVTTVNLADAPPILKHKSLIPSPLDGKEKRIRQVILIYSDNTFETFFPGAQE